MQIPSDRVKTIPNSKGLTRAEMAEGKLLTLSRRSRQTRPRTRGECVDGPRPCPWVSCRQQHAALRKALKACGLPETLTLYSCGRHSYGAHHVMGGGSLAQLREILGHSTVLVTERYGHLRPELIKVADLPAMDIDLSRPGGAVIDLAAVRRESSAAGCGVGADDIDETAGNDVSTDAT